MSLTVKPHKINGLFTLCDCILDFSDLLSVWDGLYDRNGVLLL